MNGWGGWVAIALRIRLARVPNGWMGVAEWGAINVGYLAIEFVLAIESVAIESVAIARMGGGENTVD